MAATAADDALVERVQTLTAQLEAVADPAARDCAEQLVAAVAALYGEGLERIFAALAEEGLSAAAARERLVGDGVVASLLLLHDLYPVGLEERVAQALEEVRPYLDSHGGGIELLAIEDGVARLRLRGSCDGCAASAATLEAAVETALRAAAPDLLGIDVEGRSHRRRDGRRRPRRSGSSSTARRRSRAARWRRSRARSSSPTSPARCSPTATPAPAAARRWRARCWSAGR